jgi:hypothetical protein
MGWTYTLPKASFIASQGHHFHGAILLMQNFIEALQDLETQANQLIHSVDSQATNGATIENGSSPKEQHPLYSFLKVSKHALSMYF